MLELETFWVGRVQAQCRHERKARHGSGRSMSLNIAPTRDYEKWELCSTRPGHCTHCTNTSPISSCIRAETVGQEPKANFPTLVSIARDVGSGAASTRADSPIRCPPREESLDPTDSASKQASKPATAKPAPLPRLASPKEWPHPQAAAKPATLATSISAMSRARSLERPEQQRQQGQPTTDRRLRLRRRLCRLRPSHPSPSRCTRATPRPCIGRSGCVSRKPEWDSTCPEPKG